MVDVPYSRYDFIELIEDVCKGDELLEEFIIEWEIMLLKYKSAEEFLLNMKLKGYLDSECFSFYGFDDGKTFAKWLDNFYKWLEGLKDLRKGVSKKRSSWLEDL